ncbi:MAG: glycerol-3-phosphate acyltransferase [Chloroflexi bacterium]|nr:glycerol-3-phosphate acyltransferase [Chloroflexota bacterium]
MSGDAATLIGLWAVAYLIGAMPMSYLLARALGGIDLRQHGSGNVGASNFASQMGKKWWLPIAAIDMGRGAGPVLIGQYALGLSDMAWWLVLTPLFTILGNNWSPFLRFTGGRSVGAWAGGILGIAPLFFVAGLVLYVLGWRVTRRSAEWMLVVMIALPLLALAWPERWLLVGAKEQLAVFAAGGAVLILAKRLVSNGQSAPADVPWGTVMLNRLLRDRDIANREEWLARTAEYRDDGL